VDSSEPSQRTALVTGAAKRIGAAIARALAADGWHVIVHYNSSRGEAEQLAREIARGGGRASLAHADLALPEGPDRLIEATRAMGCPVGLLVNNASQFAYDDIASVTAASLDRNFAVNARAPLLLAKGYAEELVGDGPGLIVNLLDNKVFRLNPDYLSYTIAKFALLGATRCLAMALGPRVRVNGIAPGITLVSGTQSMESFERAHKLNLTGRGSTPEDIARTVLFMAATPALTGEIVTLDGGQNLMSLPRDVAFLDKDAESAP
jgi:NAD(P)-dependent dehydrogenase (short-subunit alcohol dehydrogenase family)